MVSISYRIFNNQEQDEYPTFSLCFSGDDGGEILNQSHDVFNSNKVTRESYFNYLVGQGKDYPAQFNDLEFDDVVLDIFEGYLMEFKETNVMGEWFQLHLIPTLRFPLAICVSKNIVYRKNFKQVNEYVMLNSSMLYKDQLEVTVYVHKNGQLIRSMGTDGWGGRTMIEVGALKNGGWRNIEIGQVDVLRKRADGIIPCDEDMQDEDEYRIEQMIKNVGCCLYQVNIYI